MLHDEGEKKLCTSVENVQCCSTLLYRGGWLGGRLEGSRKVAVVESKQVNHGHQISDFSVAG